MECETFEIFRRKLFEDITEINDRFGLLYDIKKFVFLLSNPDVGKIISEYLNKALQVRTYLVENHMQNG